MYQGPVRVPVRPAEEGREDLIDVTGVVLAGGRASRFGSDKLAVTHRGRPLVEHAVIRLAEACGSVIVAIGPDASAPSFPPGLPVTVARDVAAFEGPLAALATALPHVPTTWMLVAGGDMPDLSSPVLLEMLRVASDAPADAVALAEDDRFRPLPCVVRTEPARQHIPPLLHDGERRLRTLLQSLRVAVIDEATWTALDPERRTMHDIDVPEDLQA